MANNSSCSSCPNRRLTINGYDDFVNECMAMDDKKIDCNIFSSKPFWCPIKPWDVYTTEDYIKNEKSEYKPKYSDNGDGTFTETTEEE